GEQAVVIGALVDPPQDRFPVRPPDRGRVVGSRAVLVRQSASGRGGQTWRSSSRARLKKVLRRQDKNGRRRHQKKIILRPGAWHQTPVSRACDRRRVAAQPSSVAITIRPA